MLNLYKGALVQKSIHLLLVVTVSQFLTGFFQLHSPTAQISGNRHPPLTFCICLNHFPNFRLVFHLSSLSDISDRAHVPDSPDMTGGFRVSQC